MHIYYQDISDGDIGVIEHLFKDFSYYFQGYKVRSHYRVYFPKESEMMKIVQYSFPSKNIEKYRKYEKATCRALLAQTKWHSWHMTINDVTIFFHGKNESQLTEINKAKHVVRNLSNVWIDDSQLYKVCKIVFENKMPYSDNEGQYETEMGNICIHYPEKNGFIAFH